MAKMKDEYTSAEHYLLALAGSSTPAGRFLQQAKITPERILPALQQIRETIGPRTLTAPSNRRRH